MHNQATVVTKSVLFQTGFRAFFIAAAVLAVCSMLVWMAELVFSIHILPQAVSPVLWHAHEMIYGYSLAVVAGFLLTAVRNWTGTSNLHGLRIQVLLLLWVIARIAPFFPSQSMLLLGLIGDALFIIGLSIVLTIPIIQAKLWKNMGVVSKLYFLLPGQVLYALDQFHMFADGSPIGLYIGLYMILSLLLVLSRRVVPMFIQNGIGGDIVLRNHKAVDMACFVLFLIFAISDIFYAVPMLTAVLAGLLAVLHTIRLSGWYHRAIWNKPLLWVLYIAYAWVVVGFVLKAAVVLFGVSASLATHAFAVGGVGLMTIGMMARISLGHTGRNIMQPPQGLGFIFILLMLAACVRVLFVFFAKDEYLLWIGLSQCLWVAAFGLFLYHYIAILKNPRADGKWG